MTEQSDAEKENHKTSSLNSFLVVSSAIIASIGGILFGYDIGIISGALLQLKEAFALSYFEQELVVCGVIIGAFCTSFFGGNVVDAWGRKAGIIVSCGFFIFGSVILFFSINFTMLIIGRFIVGVAISLSVTAECTYISEISPPSRRGMMVSFNEVCITIGFLLAYLMNYIFISLKNGWKYMFGVAVFPAVLQVIGVIFMPSSHHYLLIKGQKEKARKVLTLLRKCDHVDDEIEAILKSIDEQKSCRYRDLFSSTFNMRSRLFLGMALVFLQQFSGNANVLYYAPTVFQHFGYSTDVAATLVSVGLGIVKVIGTLITLSIVDKVGRRALLLSGSLLMAASIILLGIVGTVENSHPQQNALKMNIRELIVSPLDINNAQKNITLDSLQLVNKTLDNSESSQSSSSYHLRKSEFETANSSELNSLRNQGLNNRSDSNSTDGIVLNNDDPPFSTKIISVISLMVFVSSYSISYGPVTWLVLSEIFPGALRGRAVSVATCVNWGSNIIVSLTFLDVLNAMGIGPTFVTYGVICFGAAVFIFLFVPETKNKSLEEINQVLSKGMLQNNCMCQQGIKKNPKNTEQ